jgi:hypothetical protein
VAGRRAGAGLALAAVTLSAAGCGLGGGTKTVTSTVTRTVTTTRTVTQSSAPPSPCLGGQLAGTFNVVPGSAGAGHISYLLTLKNSSQTACTLTGLPNVVTLEDKNKSSLPTQVAGSPSATVVTLQPGDSATAMARFSPDVPSSQSGTCQPKAYRIEVNPGVGITEMDVKPPTSVCDGVLNFDTYAKR